MKLILASVAAAFILTACGGQDGSNPAPITSTTPPPPVTSSAPSSAPVSSAPVSSAPVTVTPPPPVYPTLAAYAGAWGGLVYNLAGVTNTLNTAITGFMIETSDGTVFNFTTTPGCTYLTFGQMSVNLTSTTGQALSMPDNYEIVNVPPYEGRCGITTPYQDVDLTYGLVTDGTFTMTSNAGPGGIVWGLLPPRAAEIASLVGNWVSASGVILTVNANGSFSTTPGSGGCVVQGYFSVADLLLNVYTDTSSYTCTDPTYAVLNGVSASGVATVQPSQNGDTLVIGDRTNGVTPVIVPYAMVRQ